MIDRDTRCVPEADLVADLLALQEDPVSKPSRSATGGVSALLTPLLVYSQRFGLNGADSATAGFPRGATGERWWCASP